MSVTVVVVAGRRSAVLSLDWSPPPSENPKNEPRKVLPPDLVMTLITPPVARPYSAGRPPVLTSISSTKSKLSCFPFSARSTPVVFKSFDDVLILGTGRTKHGRSDAIVGRARREARNRIDVALNRQSVEDLGLGVDTDGRARGIDDRRAGLDRYRRGNARQLHGDRQRHGAVQTDFDVGLLDRLEAGEFDLHRVSTRRQGQESEPSLRIRDLRLRALESGARHGDRRAGDCRPLRIQNLPLDSSCCLRPERHAPRQQQ